MLLAISCAKAVQRALSDFNEPLPVARQMQFRIGINSGDIVVKSGGEVQGDAINLAVRIQSLAHPGSVLVSRVVYEQVAELDLLEFESVGVYQLKNISREVEVYRLMPNA